ncbi:signal recognition particle 19 kDa subunit [Tieghemostelium lacteum]|uniref:Signal recognition particle 19 kDa subunit n=1 Tax=Tieghemostelium lacteum TaxID=361077 RepID=A0A152A4F2_TIELA|nr:signal recognition particle 19 kDa subunit [Tieghemostelium lacteum]|eukprot:KYR00955.1 signal recognition particle 19 kDa subunit [Tieghemostelium lacteum]
MATNTTAPPNTKKWTIVYPQYINSEVSRHDGRRTSKDQSVKNPQLEEIAKASVQLQLHTMIEKEKGYPSDYFLRGRVKIQMINDSGKPQNPDIPNKTILLIKLAEKIKENQPVRPDNFDPMRFLPLVQAVSQKEPKAEKKPTTTTTTSKGKGKKNVNLV